MYTGKDFDNLYGQIKGMIVNREPDITIIAELATDAMQTVNDEFGGLAGLDKKRLIIAVFKAIVRDMVDDHESPWAHKLTPELRVGIKLSLMSLDYIIDRIISMAKRRAIVRVDSGVASSGCC